jgi:hypothetical protein
VVTTESDPDGVQIVRFDTVDEFLSHLQSVDDIPSGSRFLFRGVPDATLPLLPSALRQPSRFEREPRNEDDQEQLELAALRRFYGAAHFGGLTIPNWPEVKEYIRLGQRTYREHALEFIALAQHYGTPTRLLDWTIDPFVAAYFAASDHPDYKLTNAKDMVVWWFDPSVIKGPGISSPWTQVTIPFDVNQNARAQRGVFVEYPKSRIVGDDGVLRESLIEVVKFRDDAPGGSPLLGAFKKFTLPRARTSQLLNALRIRHRISASTLFPGYYGAAREERERCQVGDL